MVLVNIVPSVAHSVECFSHVALFKHTYMYTCISICFIFCFFSFQGKWMYEILLGSKGIMQLGWATLQCRFTNEVSLEK